MLAISALVGLAASLALFYVVERRAAVRTVPVVVAAAPIPKGTALEPAMLRVVEWPAHLRHFSAESSMQAVVGRLTRTDLVAGEPVLEAKLRRRGERGDLDDLLARGERAMSVRVSDIVGVAAENFVDHHVDLLLTAPPGDSAVGSQVVAERVRVLAVNDTGTAERPQPIRTLTLAVALEQAKAIDDARNLGSLTALLRNPRDAGAGTGTQSNTPAAPIRPRAAAIASAGTDAAARARPDIAEAARPTSRGTDRVEVLLGSTPADP
jgi:pilus assembly protein CpaB